MNVASNTRMKGPIEQLAVVVLRLGQQQRAPTLEVAQIDVVAEGGAHDRPAESMARTTSGSGLFHVESRRTPDPVPVADRRQHWRLGEDLGVRADADLEVLRPQSGRHELALERFGLRAARPDPAKVGPDGGHQTLPQLARQAASPRAPSSMTRSMRLSANVTPHARTTCRSNGARIDGRSAPRTACHEPAISSGSSATRCRSGRRSSVRQVRAIQQVRYRGPWGRRSNAPSARIATGVGPPMPCGHRSAGRSMRPSSRPSRGPPGMPRAVRAAWLSSERRVMSSARYLAVRSRRVTR